MTRMQAEKQAYERASKDKAHCYVAVMVTNGVWDVQKYPRRKK